MNKEIIEETLGARIRKARELKGWSQEKLAEKMYITKAAISTYEVGKADMKVSRLQELAHVLDVSEAWLLNGNECDAQLEELMHLYKQIGNKKIISAAIEQLTAILDIKG